MGAREELDEMMTLGDEVESALAMIRGADDALSAIVSDAEKRQDAARDAAHEAEWALRDGKGADAEHLAAKEAYSAATAEYERAEEVASAFREVKSALEILQGALEERRVKANDALWKEAKASRSSPPSGSGHSPTGQASAESRPRQRVRPRR